MLPPFRATSLHIAEYVRILHFTSMPRMSAIVSRLYVNVSSTLFRAYSSRFPLIPVFPIRSARIEKNSIDISGKHTDSLCTTVAICAADAGGPASTETSSLPLLASVSARDSLGDGPSELIRAWGLILCTSSIVICRFQRE